MECSHCILIWREWDHHNSVPFQIKKRIFKIARFSILTKQSVNKYLYTHLAKHITSSSVFKTLKYSAKMLFSLYNLIVA